MSENDSNPPTKRSRLSSNSGGKPSSIFNLQEKNMDFLCPICFELITEAHMTRCGHTFCYPCLLQTIEHTAR